MTPGEIIAASAATLGVFLAEAAVSEYGQFLGNGVLAAVCGWLMLRVEKGMLAIARELRELQAERGRATRAQLLLLIEIPAVAAAVKGQAKQINTEVDEAQVQREQREEK